MTSDDFAAKQAELLAELPPEFRSAVSYHAWEQGHSAGYGEVLLYVSDLVDTLRGPIALYTARILNLEKK